MRLRCHPAAGIAFPIITMLATTIAISPAAAQSVLDPAIEAKIQDIVNNVAPAVVIKGQSGSHMTLESRTTAFDGGHSVTMESERQATMIHRF